MKNHLILIKPSQKCGFNFSVHCIHFWGHAASRGVNARHAFSVTPIRQEEKEQHNETSKDGEKRSVKNLKQDDHVYKYHDEGCQWR